MLLRTIVEATVGIFVPGAGDAFSQLFDWASGILGGGFLSGDWQDLLDGLFGAATGGGGIGSLIGEVLGVLPNLLNGFSPLGSDRLFGLLPFDVFSGRLPLADLFDFLPELIVDPIFEFADSILGGGIFNHDTGVTNGGSNSVKVTADGSPKELYGNVVRVTPGQNFEAGASVKWSGLAGSGSPIKVVLALFQDAAAVVETVLQSVPFSPNGGFIDIGDTVIIPEGVNQARLKLEVGETATAGDVWFATPTMTKPLAEGLWADQLGLSGVWDMLSNIFTGEFNLGNTLEDVLEFGLGLFDVLGGGPGSVLDDIFDRFFHLGSNGIFDAIGLGNVDNMSPISNDSVIPGLGLLRGVIGGGTTLGASGETWALSDLFGLFSSQSEQLAENTAALNELLSQQIEQDTSGSRAIEKFEYVDNDSLAETLWDVEWLAGNGSQARIAVVDGHNAGMERTSGSNVIQLARYNGTGHTTETDFQRVAIVVHTPMKSGNGSETHVYMRMSADRTKWVRWNFKASGVVALEYKNGGSITQLGGTAAITLPPVGTIVAGVAGTDGGARAFEAFIGTKRVHTVTDGSSVTAMGATTRDSGWGQKWGTGSATGAPGKATQFTTGDNVPVAVVGTTLRVFRATTGGITKGGGSGPVPANTFDTVDYISTDITWNPITSTAVFSKPGTYLFSGRFEMSNPIGFSEELYPTIVVNGVDRIRGGARRGISIAALGVPHFPQDKSAGGDAMMLYLQANTSVQFGFFATQSNTVIGDSAGGKTWFSAVRIG